MAVPLFLKRLLARTGVARALPGVRRHLDGGGSYLHYYGDRVLSAPVADLLDDLGAAPLGFDVIDLGAGVPGFDLVPSATTKVPADRRGPPPAGGVPELRAAVAERYYLDRRLAFNPAEEVTVVPGAAAAYAAALDAFLCPGDGVALFDPTSPLFAVGVKHRRARPRWVPTWVEGGRTRFHFEPFVKAMRGAKLLVLAEPANPSGGLLSAEDVEQIAWWADRHDVLVYLDESFARFRFEPEGAHLMATPRAARRTLLAGSLSKGHGGAALRVGWLAGTKHLVRPCTLTAALNAALVPTPCQSAALAALRQADDGFAAHKAELEANRRYAYDRLRAAGFEPVWPAGGFFFWVPVAPFGLTGRAFAEQLFRFKRVRVAPGEPFGPSGVGHVRLGFAAEEGRLREGLTRLGEFAAELRAAAGPALPAAELAAAQPAA